MENKRPSLTNLMDSIHKTNRVARQKGNRKVLQVALNTLEDYHDKFEAQWIDQMSLNFWGRTISSFQILGKIIDCIMILGILYYSKKFLFIALRLWKKWGFSININTVNVYDCIQWFALFSQWNWTWSNNNNEDVTKKGGRSVKGISRRRNIFRERDDILPVFPIRRETPPRRKSDADQEKTQTLTKPEFFSTMKSSRNLALYDLHPDPEAEWPEHRANKWSESVFEASDASYKFDDMENRRPRDDNENEESRTSCCGLAATNAFHLTCSLRCAFSVHTRCVGRIGAGELCPTPDCEGLIIKKIWLNHAGRPTGRPETFTIVKQTSPAKEIPRDEPKLLSAAMKNQKKKAAINQNQERGVVPEKYKEATATPPLALQVPDDRHFMTESVEIKKNVEAEASEETTPNVTRRKQNPRKTKQLLNIEPLSLISQRQKTEKRVHEWVPLPSFVNHVCALFNISKGKSRGLVMRFGLSGTIVAVKKIPAVMDFVKAKLELERLEEIGLEGNDREEYDEAVVEEILEEEDVCPVCLEKVEQDKEVLKCGHEFHQLCIEEWLRHQTSCPTCRSFAILTQEYPNLN